MFYCGAKHSDILWGSCHVHFCLCLVTGQNTHQTNFLKLNPQKEAEMLPYSVTAIV